MRQEDRHTLFYTGARFDVGKTARLFELETRQRAPNDVLLRVALREALAEIARLQALQEPSCSAESAEAARR